jgi:hypothetical protein
MIYYYKQSQGVATLIETDARNREWLIARHYEVFDNKDECLKVVEMINRRKLK